MYLELDRVHRSAQDYQGKSNFNYIYTYKIRKGVADKSTTVIWFILMFALVDLQ